MTANTIELSLNDCTLKIAEAVPFFFVFYKKKTVLKNLMYLAVMEKTRLKLISAFDRGYYSLAKLLHLVICRLQLSILYEKIHTIIQNLKYLTAMEYFSRSWKKRCIKAFKRELSLINDLKLHVSVLSITLA